MFKSPTWLRVSTLALALALSASSALAQSVLLPNGKQQFLDENGDPLASGTVGMYVPATLTPKNTWQDPTNSTLNANPIVLDSAGEALIYGSGVYRQIVKDVFGNTVWDALTAGNAGPFPAWGGTSTGSGNAQVVAVSSFTATTGAQIAWKAGFSNSGSMTLTIGSNGPYTVYADTPAGPAALVGNEVRANNVYIATYDSGLGGLHLTASMTGPFAVVGGTVVSSAISASTITTSTISNSDIVLKQSAIPTPTTSGAIEYGTTADALYVGDGAATDVFWAAPPAGLLWGCGTANNTTDATNDIDFSTGTVVSSDNDSRATCPAYTKRLDANWAAGTNQGMRYSGAAITNTTYHLYAVWQPGGASPDYYADPSASAATVLSHLQAESGGSAYTEVRRIASIVRTGGAIKAYTQVGDLFTWAVIVSDVSTANPGTSAVTATLTVPTGITVLANCTFGLYDSTPTTANYGLITALTQTDTAPGFSAFNVFTDSSEQTNTTTIGTVTNTSGQVRYRLAASNADIAAIIQTIGWSDSRGRLQ